jgi:hypothetical protein
MARKLSFYMPQPTLTLEGDAGAPWTGPSGGAAAKEAWKWT